MRRTKNDAMETRNAILDAAEDVFHRHGVSRASLADIASEAQVTRGAIYWHFAGKVELFKAMSDRVSAPEEAFFLQRAEGADVDDLAGLKALSLEMLRRFAANARAQRVHEILLFRCEYIGDFTAARRDKEMAFENAILGLLGRLKGEGRLGPGWSPETASTALRCVVMGAISDWLRLGRTYDLPEIGAALLDALFDSFARGRPG